MCLHLQGGMYIYQLIDWYIAAVFVPVVCVLECVIVGWLYGEYYSYMFPFQRFVST